MSTKLGTTQRDFLSAVNFHVGIYRPGSGWVWNNTSTSVRLAETLVKRGLLKVDPTGAFRITEAGRIELNVSTNLAKLRAEGVVG